MPIITTNDFIDQISNQRYLTQPIWGRIGGTTGLFGNNRTSLQRVGFTKTLPNPLPSGITNYIVTRASAGSSTGNLTILIAKLINFGSIDIAGASGTFTDGVAMPTVTELGVARVISSPVFIEVTTTLNVTPGSLAITYVDQDGNAAESTTAQTLISGAIVGNSGFIVLNGTDIGVQDITAATRSGGATPTGVVQFWGVIPISFMSDRSNLAGQDADNLIAQVFNPVRLGAGDVIGCFILASTAAKTLTGELFIVGDD